MNLHTHGASDSEEASVLQMESKILDPRLEFDPREPPPLPLKTLFKSLKGTNWERYDEQILDLNRTSHIWGGGSHSHLQEVFSQFISGVPGDTISSLSNSRRADLVRNSYTSKKIPGLVILPSLLPPFVQQDLLSRLLHRDLSNLEHKTNLHLHWDVNYPNNGASFFTLGPATPVLHPKDPSTHQVIQARKVLDKQLRWMTLGGQYDWTNKEYPAEAPPEFPRDIAALLRGIFQNMEPEAAIVNIYSPGDTLSIHRDVSEEVDRGLVSISLGCDAIFIIGLYDKESGETKSEVLRLRSGDAVYMTGESRFAWHGVPSIIPNTCPKFLESWPAQYEIEASSLESTFEPWRSWMKNKRVNLNVRQMRDK